MEIAEEYRKLVCERYGCCTVVFDGYGNGPSIKDREHTRRRCKFLAEVDVNSSIIFQLNQQDFLANDVNKSKFIRFLVGHLSGHGYVIGQSSNDANTLIVKHALQSAKSGYPTVDVADDTDIIVLLVHQYQMNTMEDVFFQSETTRRSKSGLRIISIRKAVSNYDAKI